MTNRIDQPARENSPAYEAETVADLADLFGPERFAQMLSGLDEEIVRRLGTAGPDDPDLGGHAHALVSVSGTLGFMPLSGACAALERACLEGGDVAGRLRDAQEQAALARLAITSLRGGG